jgi:hypothetical protein
MHKIIVAAMALGTLAIFAPDLGYAQADATRRIDPATGKVIKLHSLTPAQIKEKMDREWRALPPNDSRRVIPSATSTPQERNPKPRAPIPEAHCQIACTGGHHKCLASIDHSYHLVARHQRDCPTEYRQCVSRCPLVSPT